MIFVGIPKEADLAKYLDQLPAIHQVYFEGEVNADEILNYYPLFDVKILASDMEGLSQSLLEAMAMGIPVIATDAAGNPDLIKREVNGLLFQDGDIKELASAITKLYQNPAVRDTLATNGKQSAFVDFSLENTVKAYEEYFEHILKKDS
jgi:glycosyltransferase involved in cell wall biosynthesis